MDYESKHPRVWRFLTRLATLVIKKYRPGVVGVAGNVGKTSTKEAITAVLRSERRVRATSQHIPSRMAIPLAIIGVYEEAGGFWFLAGVVLRAVFLLLFRYRLYPEILLLEYGVRTSQDMKFLLEIVRPQIVVFTTIGSIPSHPDFLDNPKALQRELLRLVQQLSSTGFAVMNGDDDDVVRIREQSRAQVITFGFSKKSDLLITQFSEEFTSEGALLSFKVEYAGNMIPIRLKNVLGRGQAYAAAAALATGIVFGLNLVKIADILASFTAPPGRLRVIAGLRGSIIIDDSFNAAPLALEEALNELKKTRAQRRIAVLSDMADLSRYTNDIHHAAGEYAATVCDILITIGVRGKLIAEGALRAGMARRSVYVFNSIPEAKRLLETLLRVNDVVLVKGSADSRMERLVRDIMREPGLARNLLARQNFIWDGIPGLYDRDVARAEVASGV